MAGMDVCARQVLLVFPAVGALLADPRNAFALFAISGHNKRGIYHRA